MPHANVWIRKEDWDKWQALKSKSEFVHSALNAERTGKIKVATLEPLAAIVVDKAPSNEPGAVSRVNIVKEIPEPTLRNSAGLCANGHPIPGGRSKCMGKGCKYS